MTQTKRSSFTVGYVQPNGQSSQRLSEGLYSLSARSNVPFVRLVGKSVDKTFTWGEIVEVPKGELCSINNASWHAGDIFINGGCDYDNRPARITVPVPYVDEVRPPGEFWYPAFPADVRMARRAYVSIGGFTPAPPSDIPTVIVVGYKYDGSHNTFNEISAFVILGYTGAGYIDTYTLPLSSYVGMIPLGKSATLGDDSRPHALLTAAEAYIDTDVVGDLVAGSLNAYYVMEY